MTAHNVFIFLPQQLHHKSTHSHAHLISTLFTKTIWNIVSNTLAQIYIVPMHQNSFSFPNFAKLNEYIKIIATMRNGKKLQKTEKS